MFVLNGRNGLSINATHLMGYISCTPKRAITLICTQGPNGPIARETFFKSVSSLLSVVNRALGGHFRSEWAVFDSLFASRHLHFNSFQREIKVSSPTLCLVGRTAEGFVAAKPAPQSGNPGISGAGLERCYPRDVKGPSFTQINRNQLPPRHSGTSDKMGLSLVGFQSLNYNRELSTLAKYKLLKTTASTKGPVSLHFRLVNVPPRLHLTFNHCTGRRFVVAK